MSGEEYRKIELEKDIAISNELNQSDFSKRMLSDEDYTISVNKNEFLMSVIIFNSYLASNSHIYRNLKCD